MFKVLVSFLLLISSLFGAEVFGIIKKIQGNISSNNKALSVNDQVMIGSTLTSSNNSKAIIAQENGNIITIGENCNFLLSKLDEVEPKSGSAFFNITKSLTKLADSQHSFKIKIKTASLGIRGTDFIVTNDKGENVILRNGELDILSNNKEDFKLYAEKLNKEYQEYASKDKKEFENYVKNLMNDFEAYKKKHTFEFEQYAKSFKLEEKTMITIGSNNEVYKVKLNKEAIKNLFSEFDNFTDIKSLPPTNSQKNNEDSVKSPSSKTSLPQNKQTLNIQFPTNNTTLSSEGYGNTINESVQDALFNLSSQISVDVNSKYKSYVGILNNNYVNEKSKFVELTSNLPIKGSTLSTTLQDNVQKTIATLSTDSSLQSYTTEIAKLFSTITDSLEQINNTNSSSLKYNLLQQTVENITLYDKYCIVATFLGAKGFPSLHTELLNSKQQLILMEQKVDNLDMAVNVLSKNIAQDNIYITPIKNDNSNQVTQFAKVLKDKFSTKMKSVKYSDVSKYTLRGKYEMLKDDAMFVSVELVDANNSVVHTNNVVIDKKAFGTLEYIPTTKSFDESLISDFVKSGKLQVSIGFKGYNRANNIDLMQGDKVDLIVKSNKSMCYFILGHILKNSENFSYVLPIGTEQNSFINKITGDDVNQNITIASDIVIEEPFGSENIQIFASTLGSGNSCSLVPPKCIEKSNGYCVVSENPSNVVLKARGLNLKKATAELEKAETNLSFTSFKK